MKTAQALLAGGVLLLVLCVAGCPKSPTTTAPQEPPPGQQPGAGPGAFTGVALGEHIYKTGIGASGTHVVFDKGGDRFKQKPGGCGGCHGEDARGKKIPGKPGIPAITYAALREPRGDKPAEFPDDEAVKTAVTKGLNEKGEPLSPVMPRWHFTDAEFGALVEYLKKLSTAPPVAEPTKPAADAKPAEPAKPAY